MKKILMIVVLAIGVIFIGSAKIGANMNNEVTQVRASHILVDTENEALDLKKQIDDGTITFEKAALEHSKCPSGRNGGDLGYFQKGMMVSEFEKASFEAPVGTVTNPVKTQFGWHLIKVIDKK